MNDDLMNDERPAEERAFERGAAPMWKEKLIKPLSGRRLIAAQSCGLKLFKAAAAASDGAELGAYDGIFWDAAIVVFLCSSPNEVVLMAVQSPKKVCAMALDWVDEQNLTPGTPDFVELIELFNRIMGDVMASITEPVRKEGEKEGAQKKIPGSSTGSPSSLSKSDTSQEETPPTS